VPRARWVGCDEGAAAAGAMPSLGQWQGEVS
jgi:hypothetical protein